jgi:hypothetical protein
VLDTWSFVLRTAQKFKILGALWGGSLGAWALRARIPGASPGLDRLRRYEAVRVAVVSYPWGISHLNGRPAPRIIVDTHDLISLERIQEGHPGRLDVVAYLTLRKELFYLGVTDEVWSISYAECWFMQAFLGEHRVRFVPPALASWTGPVAGSSEPPQYDLVFVGSDNRWNGDSLAGFLRSCAEWQLSVTIGIAGAVCQNEEVRVAAEKIAGASLLGFVDNLGELYASTRAAICPVEGTGTKIKLIEALRAARPVFAAPGAMSGLIPGFEQCVFPITPETIRRILHDPQAITAAQLAASKYSEAYGFDRVAGQVRAAIEQQP